MTDQLWGSYRGLELHRAHFFNPLLWTDRSFGAAKSDWIQSYNDIGGALWRSEPMMEFMRRTVWMLDSPYWNPYSSAGSLGPETLVDLKFSIFTIAYSLLGGGTFVYGFLLLTFFWLGTYFLIRLVREKLELSTTAAIAAGIFYLLNGYAVGNIGSNTALSYLFIPMCLFAMFSFTEQMSLRRFALVAFATAALFSFTFLPTTIVSVIALLGCTIGFSVAKHRGGTAIARSIASMTAGQLLAAAAGVALLALIYLPLGESLSTTGLLERYSNRIFYPAQWTGALSLFTRSHFFVFSWGNMDADATRLSGNTLYNFGVVCLVLAAAALGRHSRWRLLVWTCLAMVAVVLARIFAVPGVREFFELLPIVRNLGEQYLWVAVAVPMTLLVAFGTDDLRSGTAAPIPAMIVLVVGIAAAVPLALAYGIRGPDQTSRVTAIATLAVLGIAAAAAVWLAPRAKMIRRGAITGSAALAAAIVVLIFLELSAEARWQRFEANDSFVAPTSEVPFLQSHAHGYRTMTLGAYATTMDRGGAYGLQEVTSLNEETLPGFRNYFNQMTRSLPAQYRMGNFVSLAFPQDASDLGYYDWNLVDLLGVKYIVVPRTSSQYLEAFGTAGFPRVHDSQFTVVFQNPEPLPRAFAADLGVSPGTSATELTLPADVRQRITPATISRYRNTEVEITGTADRARLVVLTDNWHPNWRASLNGTPAQIARVNGTFRGVWVEPGPFTIEMSYAPKTLPAATAISLLSLLALTAMTVAGSRRMPLDHALPWLRGRLRAVPTD